MVKSVYGALRDFFSLFARRKGEKSLQVVAVDIPGTGMRLLGFVTRTEFTDVPNGVGGEGDVAVYLPMSYQIGGYTVFLPRKRVRQVDMSREAVPADARAQVEVAWEARTGKARLKPLACTVRPRSATRSLNRLVYESELRTREAGGERELRRVNRD